MHFIRRLAAAAIVFGLTSLVSQAEACSRSEARQAERALESMMANAGREIVTFRSGEFVELSRCRATDSAILAGGRYYFYGTDDAEYWMEGSITVDYSGRVRRFQTTDYNGNFVGLAVIKGVVLAGAAVAACSSDAECSRQMNGN